MRRGALLNVAQVSGMVPTSVGGGENADGNWSLMAGLCGPGSAMLLGFVALTAPGAGHPDCRGRSLPSQERPWLRSVPSLRRPRLLSPTPHVLTSFSCVPLVWTKGICSEMDAGRRTKFTDD